MMDKDTKQYTCPDFGVGGAGPQGPYYCHVCPDKVWMCRSSNGKILNTDEMCKELKEERRLHRVKVMGLEQKIEKLEKEILGVDFYHNK